jgi:RNA 2',3'-cyclic 3'-phosphodiesterase
MRLFIAIELPDDLKTELGKLKMDIPGVRWVPKEQIHLTLDFLGEVEETTVERLTGKLARRHAPGFKLRLSGTGCFPNRRRPHVLWVGLEPEHRLNELAADVHSAVLSCGIQQEERPFSPHITLARIKLSPSRDFDSFLDRHQNLKLPPFSVREFTLFQSRLTPQGAVHIPVRNFPLAAAEVSGKH